MRRFALLLVAFVCACHTGDDTAGSIVIGHYGSLTGSEATFGRSTKQGIELAIEELNAAGGVSGKKLVLASYDDGGSSQEAGTAVTRLITSDKVVAVIGENASSRSIAGGRVAQRYGVPMISPSSTSPQVTQVGDKVFRICFVDAYQAWALAEFAYGKLGARTMAVIYDQGSPHATSVKTELAKRFGELGGRLVAEQAYGNGDQDFSAQLTSIRLADPDVVAVPGYYTDAGNIALQARRVGVSQPLLGSDGWDSPQVIAIAGQALEGSYYTTHYANDEQRPAVQEFVKRFAARFGAPPQDVLAALGYDAVRILAEALRRAPSLSGDDVAAALAKTHDFAGVTGAITIDSERNARKPVVVLQIKEGVPHHVATIAPP